MEEHVRYYLKIIFLISVFSSVFYGCVGSPIHASLTYKGIQSTIRGNNASLVRLETGMSQDEVRSILGAPERSEGYDWGSAWLYRTAMTNGLDGGLYGSTDADYTPVMFDQNKVLIGWGRNFYDQRVNKHEITINNR